MTNLKGKNGIIFGSTGILGSRISLDLARMDTNLILHGKSIEKLIKLDDKINRRVKNLIFSLTNHVAYSKFILSKLRKKSIDTLPLKKQYYLLNDYRGVTHC